MISRITSEFVPRNYKTEKLFQAPYLRFLRDS